MQNLYLMLKTAIETSTTKILLSVAFPVVDRRLRNPVLRAHHDNKI
jgi:hypothetical protein